MEKYIYKITNCVNNKIYIGQTNDYQRRFREHKNRAYGAKQSENKPLYNAIQKYGIDNFKFEIIEKTKDYNEREQYWIEYYDSTNINKGYNVDFPLIKPHIGRLSEEQIQQIYWDLKNTNKTFQELQKEYNLKTEDSIRNINRGIVYYHPNQNYPIRPYRKSIAKEKTLSIIEDLKDSSKTIQEIADKYNTLPSYIYQLNKGDRVKIDGVQYPIRETQKKKKTTKLTKEEVKSIKDDIKNTKLTWEELGIKYNRDRKVFQHINQGQTHFDPLESYPLRPCQTYRKVQEEKVLKAIELLQNSSLLQKEIAKETQISEPVIRKIKNGVEPYHYDYLSYPLR